MKNREFNRLFVPLSSDPFQWFASGRKRWELRRYGRQYTTDHVILGRTVELRKGYSNRESVLWGTIVDVRRAPGIRDFFRQVPFAEVIPVAGSEEEAIQMATKILALTDAQSQEVLGFCVELRQKS